jgi:hypothetical protein
MAVDAGIDVTNSECICLLEKNVRLDIIDRIYLISNIPAAYLVFCERVLSVGRLWEQWQEQKAAKACRSAPPPILAKPAMFTMKLPPVPKYHLATGTILRG